MIDIHTHILPFIDDGADDINESYAMIEKSIAIGISDIILTPHALRFHRKNYQKTELALQYQNFIDDVKKKYDVNLYLGQEITYQRDMISLLKKDELFSLNDSRYILLELPFLNEIEDFDELVFSFRVLGYKIIIAHVERYSYLTFSKIEEMRNYGVLFQVNSNSITGRSGKQIQKLAMKLFKKQYVEFVASDVHSFRKNDMDIAYRIIEEKSGKNTAEAVFSGNARQLLNIKKTKS